ncbi:type III pantothenate kinase [Chryseotalea sanaruensis]|uniref:Type III pantothenate kinase n=1 Tax=Chryseotalea sanaruensis TaxID=2482724 RepID=A0A401U781_9BACT|nr:type III pantothenate kinase [Chryseotalea sanaruensis]GCC50744.1 type III pantothenate kinase [Chryseotalea sanaruensis]
MDNLVVDIGNTSSKVGIFKQHNLLEERVFADHAALREYLLGVRVQAVIVASVSKTYDTILPSLTHIPSIITLTHNLPLPIVNLYATPETLGVDRLAGVCGAVQMFPAEPCLVIDSGTCITYDFINQNAEYLGGAISPGLNMRLRAMHEFTARLPQVAIEGDIPLIGNTTKSCMQSGALNGMCVEIEGTIERYRQHYPQMRVILCGGDTHFFENSLKGAIFAVPNLVLKGLNSILLHNVSQ